MVSIRPSNTRKLVTGPVEFLQHFCHFRPFWGPEKNLDKGSGTLLFLMTNEIDTAR